jgi:hypothetical protein
MGEVSRSAGRRIQTDLRALPVSVTGSSTYSLAPAAGSATNRRPVPGKIVDGNGRMQQLRANVCPSSERTLELARSSSNSHVVDTRESEDSKSKHRVAHILTMAEQTSRLHVIGRDDTLQHRSKPLFEQLKAIEFSSQFAYFGSALVVAGGFYGITIAAGAHTGADFKSKLSDWLSGGSEATWSSQFIRLFDGLFGENISAGNVFAGPQSPRSWRSASCTSCSDTSWGLSVRGPSEISRYGRFS